LREIRTFEKNWPAVAAMQVEEFVRHSSRKAFTDCKKASGRVKPSAYQEAAKYLRKAANVIWRRKSWQSGKAI
ncbi:MAG: hypothetical protein PVJ00_03970, partial [Desulfobacterales bacterium]|jgi:glutaredoxin 2